MQKLGNLYLDQCSREIRSLMVFGRLPSHEHLHEHSVVDLHYRKLAQILRFKLNQVWFSRGLVPRNRLLSKFLRIRKLWHERAMTVVLLLLDFGRNPL